MNYEAPMDFSSCNVAARSTRLLPPLYQPTALPGRKTRNRQTALPAGAGRPRGCPDVVKWLGLGCCEHRSLDAYSYNPTAMSISVEVPQYRPRLSARRDTCAIKKQGFLAEEVLPGKLGPLG